MPVYLIHFEEKLHHAGHYLGYTKDLEARIRLHQLGRGAKLMRAVRQAGIGWEVVRTWDGGRDLESALKALKNSPRICPLCVQRAQVARMQIPAPSVSHSARLW